MLDAMIYRGPDEEGSFTDGPVSLAMRRLSIIDLAGGRQPIFSDDKSIVLVFNGEIYNYIELRRDLKARGARFRTDSDTEVILRLYEEKGIGCLDDLNGMFAIAIWDSRRHELFLARDRVGIKPLHYCVTGEKLLFSSEINSLIAGGEVGREMDSDALKDYFTFFYIPGERTIYKSIRRLPPAHAMVWRDGKCRTWRYWRVKYSPPPARLKPIDYYAERYREQLNRSVRMQLRSDVPLGVFLSGGLDSGSIVAAVAETTAGTCKTFTIGFDDESYDESPQAKMTADMYGCDHHHFRLGPQDILRCAELAPYFGEPYGPFTIVQAHMICRYSRDRVTVALAGDGGDELFGGYQTYTASNVVRHYLRLPKSVRRGFFERVAKLLPVSDKLLSLDFKIREFVRGAEMFQRGRNMAWKVIFNDREQASLLAPDALRTCREHDPFACVRQLESLAGQASDLQKAMHVDLSMFLPDCILTQTDRMSMAVSQEVRVPILDHEMVEFAATVPDRYKAHRGRTKILLRHALQNRLPEGVLNKPKTGFTTPIPVWIRGELKEFVLDTLSPAALKRTGLFNAKFVEKIIDEHLAGQNDHARRIWSLVSFMLWYEKCYRGIHSVAGG